MHSTTIMTAVNIIYSKALTAMKYDIGLVYRSATWIENVQGLNFNANSEVGIVSTFSNTTVLLKASDNHVAETLYAGRYQ